MKNLLSIALCIISTLTFSQEFQFKPNWKKGDFKKIAITQVEKEYENEVLISDTVIYNEASIKVVRETNEAYEVEVEYENQALRIAIDFYQDLGEELKKYKDLNLKYSINKETGEAELLNWKEVQTFVDQSFEQIKSKLEEKVPDIAPFIGLAFKPLSEIFSSKENIESYMSENIGYMLIPFIHKYQLGDTITIVETEENPFNTSQEISATTLLTLVSINESNKTCLIHQDVILDLSEFNNLIKGLMQNMAKSFGVDDSVSNNKSAEIDQFEFDILNSQEIMFNYETTWVNKVVTSAIVTGADPSQGVKTRKEVISTAIFE